MLEDARASAFFFGRKNHDKACKGSTERTLEPVLKHPEFVVISLDIVNYYKSSISVFHFLDFHLDLICLLAVT
jgi:hypothetical protein